MVDVLDDAADKTREGERWRVEESDGEGDAGGYPFRIPQLPALGYGLESRHKTEDDCEREHEDAALRRELPVA